ncbi:HAD-IA family hydrolase [Candidatus Woesearchaeota archaeon]|jgi:HAD superfamily hydrolase (TIGR01509 family)|nr:HAD-IA family hydrolase [Candidatus Woesearchaeota archaeon]MBT4387947.1 HAD-IA family hydrolase [Candidatus Woesearchaeota archaeon]MBT4595765.1 HAD-IA family hydrolase [Candidatus Woesearchaeota archaeon]MBT5741386.1 HAD-IA family hydrolase [Candidatus Woesearchaeota archaeon]MBT6505208.1 HAD-IA family hydrolase [Candidatus Woesearchaeota archaeon]
MINTIIFDFAGVIAKTKYFPQLALNLGKQFNIDPKVIEKQLYGNESEYLIGKESTENFWKNSCSKLGIPLDDFIHAFKTWYKLDLELLNFIKELKKHYQIILHSDNFEVVSSNLRENQKLKEVFEQMFFSDEIHMNKRNVEAFKHVICKIDKSPSDCIFTDDKEANLVAPAQIGIKTIKYENLEQFKKELASYSIKFN